MPIPASINDLSTTASLNSPSGSESPGILDDIQRVHGSFIATLRDQVAQKSDTSALIISKSFDSGDLTILSGDGVTLVHGLGVYPKLTQVLLKCVTADLGYSPGEYVLVPSDAQFDGTNSRGIQLFYPDANSISYVVGSNANAFVLVNKSTRSVGSIVNANWKLVIRAYA
jgi:hypothetical protein